MPSKVPVTVTFQDPSGTPIADGSVTFSLNIDISAAASDGPQIAAGRIVTATLDSSGSATVDLWPNDLISTGSVYFVEAFSAQGEPAWNGQMTVS